MTGANIVVPEAARAIPATKKDIISNKTKSIKGDSTTTSLKTDKTATKKEKVSADANDNKVKSKEHETKAKKIKAYDNTGDVTVPMIITDVPTTIDMETATTTTIVKPKHKTLSFQEDPMQFHAKPRDLAKNALKRPREMDTNANVTNHIFSRVSFSSLPLDVRLSGLLEKSTAEVCTIFLN